MQASYQAYVYHATDYVSYKSENSESYLFKLQRWDDWHLDNKRCTILNKYENSSSEKFNTPHILPHILK